MITIRPHLKSAAVFSIAIGILVLGGFLRIGAVLDSEIKRDLWADSHEYFTYAYNLRKHGVYSHYNLRENGIYSHSDRVYENFIIEPPPPPDNFKPPGYPLFVYLFLTDLPAYIDNQNVKPALYRIKFAQAILSTVTVLITFLISRYLLGATLALAPMLIVAIAPHLIIANLYILTETLFCFILSLSVLLIGWSYGRSPFYNIFVGVLIAVASLVKPAFLYFIIPLCLVFWFLTQKKLRYPSLLFLALGFAVVYSPWVIRNQMSTNIVSDKNLMAQTLLAGAYPDLMYDNDPRSYPYPYLRDPNYEKNSSSTASTLTEIWRRFLNRPTQFIKWYLVGKPILLWQWDITHGQRGAFVYPVRYSPYNSSGFYKFTYELSRIIQWPLVILGLIGCIIAWLPMRRNVLSAKGVCSSHVISMILFYFLFVYVATFADARYAVPLRPILTIMAMLPMLYLGARIKRALSART